MERSKEFKAAKRCHLLAAYHPDLLPNFHSQLITMSRERAKLFIGLVNSSSAFISADILSLLSSPLAKM